MSVELTLNFCRFFSLSICSRLIFVCGMMCVCVAWHVRAQREPKMNWIPYGNILVALIKLYTLYFANGAKKKGHPPNWLNIRESCAILLARNSANRQRAPLNVRARQKSFECLVFSSFFPPFFLLFFLFFFSFYSPRSLSSSLSIFSSCTKLCVCVCLACIIHGNGNSVYMNISTFATIKRLTLWRRILVTIQL